MLPVSPIGRYMEADSVVHSLDARTKSVCVLLAIVACLSIGSAWSLAMVVAFFFLAVASAGTRLTAAIGSVRLALFLVAVAAIFNFLFWRPDGVGEAAGAARSFVLTPRPRLEGLSHGVLVGLRLVLMVSFVNLFLLSTPPSECGEAVGYFVRPLRRIARSVAVVPLVVMIALRFIPLVVAEGNRILAAQRSRGMSSGRKLAGRVRELKALVVPLFRSVLRRADELSVALDVRCFDPYKFQRSAFGRRLGWGDASALACSACVLGLVRLVG
ncbi:MAG: energy-coupling factor transporter transmembrane protein EcfT [Candidatus Eisenbacteria bacterium]|nr:energy-coupling factor transporter transmembrane protein EcfT [Candidatus Eisenbacteria bacterium]